jgi:chromosomal replication initiation ATPase DnaA
MSLAENAATDTRWLDRWRETTAKKWKPTTEARVPIRRDWLILTDMIQAEPSVPTKMTDLIRIVCARHNLTEKAVLGPWRQKHIVAARFEICYLARALLCRSLPEIGRQLGRRDHTTVHHAVEKFRKLHDLPPPHEAPYDLVCKILFQGVGGGK